MTNPNKKNVIRAQHWIRGGDLGGGGGGGADAFFQGLDPLATQSVPPLLLLSNPFLADWP